MKTELLRAWIRDGRETQWGRVVLKMIFLVIIPLFGITIMLLNEPHFVPTMGDYKFVKPFMDNTKWYPILYGWGLVSLFGFGKGKKWITGTSFASALLFGITQIYLICFFLLDEIFPLSFIIFYQIGAGIVLGIIFLILWLIFTTPRGIYWTLVIGSILLLLQSGWWIITNGGLGGFPEMLVIPVCLLPGMAVFFTGYTVYEIGVLLVRR